MAANNDEPEVKDVDVVHIEPAGKDAEDVENTEETDPESSQEETSDDAEGTEPEDENRPDGLTQRATPPAADAQGDEGDEIARIEGETPREYALRLELNKTRKKLRQERSEDLLGNERPTTAKKELSPERKAILEKYKPEEIQALREVFPALAEEMGFVRQDELAGNTYAEKAQGALDSFLEKHPEYLPENDKDGTLWNGFKAEFGMFKQPSDPKEFTKIFERIHRDVFGIQPKGALKTVNAQREKASVASHAGASSTPAAQRQTKPVANTRGIRLDMLKGFDDDEIASMTGDE